MTDPPSTSLDQNAILVETPDPLALAFEEQSDLGNAARLKVLAGGKLKWIEDLQAWAWYDGKRFDPARGAIAAQRIAHDVIRHIRDEARAVDLLLAEGDEELLRRYRGPKATIEGAKTLPGQLRKHALKSGSAAMTAGMLRQARSDLAVLSEDFDKDELVYNCLNGTLRFVKVPSPGADAPPSPAEGRGAWEVRFQPHDPADQLMQLADVEYDPSAKAPFWEERMERLHPDKEQLASLKLLYGSTLTGFTDDQAFYVHQGRGNDGKSASHRAVGQLHGDYFRHAGVKTFLQGSDRGGAEHRSDLVRLNGDIRFVTCDEPKERSTWDGETIKQVTGSLITARGSGERTEVTYEPHFKLVVECNNIPRPPSDDKGFRRRFRLFQWLVSLPMAGEEGHVSLHDVLERLKGERSGILNWMIDGCLEWLETRHVPESAAMQSVLKDYWAAASPMLDWLDDRCDVSEPDVLTYASELYADFKAFREGRGDEKVMSQTAFGTKLRDKHFLVVKDSKGLAQRKGIRLLSEYERSARFAAAADVASSPAPLSNGLEAGRGKPSGIDDDDDPYGAP